MADTFVQLTRIDAQPRGTPILVNLGSVAWIEPGADETSRVVFACGCPNAAGLGAPLTIVVREPVEEIALLASVEQRSDREAIAQAWADQRGRREMDEERQ